jgi:hypothetical protein
MAAEFPAMRERRVRAKVCYAALLLVPILGVGCQTAPCRTEREKLAVVNPSLESKWDQLYETSVPAEESRFVERRETRDSWEKTLIKYRDVDIADLAVR